MTESSRKLPKSFLEKQARLLGLDLAAVDSDALLQRVRSGLEDLDRADELPLDDHEPAVTFHSSSDIQ